MYTFRESIVLGKTNFSIFKVNQILRELSREWPGSSYDLLAKNCNHFCDEFCERLDVPKLPGKYLTKMILVVHSFFLKDDLVIFWTPCKFYGMCVIPLVSPMKLSYGPLDEIR